MHAICCKLCNWVVPFHRAHGPLGQEKSEGRGKEGVEFSLPSHNDFKIKWRDFLPAAVYYRVLVDEKFMLCEAASEAQKG